ncbi:MAG: GPR endopeptidase [Erysipelotrichaceae bacterium]|nr:GPR endopeptidase [Erysipelotrichaceae bacterium]
MNYRTDFADEIVLKQNKDIKKITKNYSHIKMTMIDILKEDNIYNKEKGRYISLDFKYLFDKTIRDEIKKVLVESLNTIYKIKKKDKVLIVGLGNQRIIADSLGPSVADKIMVTNHLFNILPLKEKKKLKRVCVFTPKVMGQTGLESADLINAVCKIFTPNVIIVIDALASSSITRINKSIQLSDTGISPGSGVGNYRKEISEKTTKCKVLAIGVATVVEASQIIKEINKNIKIPNDQNYQLVLTPKEIDEDIEHLANIISQAINQYIHEDYKLM